MPRLIAAAAHTRPPRSAHFRASDLPKGSVRQPGERGYHGPYGDNPKYREAWERRVPVQEAKDELRRTIRSGERKVGRIGLYGSAASAGLGLGVGAAADLLSRREAGRIKAGHRDKQLLRKGYAASPLMRAAERGRGGSHVVTGVQGRPGRLERLERWATPDRNYNKLSYGGLILGGAGMAVGSGIAQGRLDAAGRKRKAVLRRQMVGQASGRGSKQTVTKGLYRREDKVDPLRAAGFLAGAGLAAYGLGRSGMVGRALGQGVKLASQHGNQQVVNAIQRAEAARGVLRAGTAPGEAALRRVKAVDDALRLVPASMRGDVALVTGAILANQSRPVRQTHYYPAVVHGRPTYW